MSEFEIDELADPMLDESALAGNQTTAIQANGISLTCSCCGGDLSSCPCSFCAGCGNCLAHSSCSC
jgi:hypothetical protein